VDLASVAVAIVNANSGPLLARSLTALEKQTRRPDLTVVVDNASTDGSAADVENRFPGVKVLRLEENVGFAAANNLAADEAEGCEWLALLNPDAFPEPGWLESLLQAAEERPDCSFFASHIVMAADPERLDSTGDVLHVSGVAWQRNHGAPSSATPPAGEVFSACAAAALYRRDVFLAAGGFDERFFCYLEDVDLSFRLRLQGHRCWYVPDAVVEHVGSAASGSESDFLLYHSHRNMVWAFAKNMPTPLFWVYLPQHVLFNVLVLLAYLRLGRARLIIRAKADAVRGLRQALRDRREIQRRKKVASRELLALMARGVDIAPILRRRSRELADYRPTDSG
jgi:GT2 family glycosyltransferase